MPDKLTIEITAAVTQALAGLKQTADAIVSLQATTVTANAASAAATLKHESAVSNLWLAYKTAPSAGALLKDVGAIASGVGVTIGRDLAGAAEKGASALGVGLVAAGRGALVMLENLGNSIQNVGTNLLKSFGPLLGLGIAAGIAVMLEQAISKTIAWDDAIAVLSRDLQFNTVVASTWAARASFVGIQVDQLQSAFTRLSVAIVTHSADLASMGIAVSDSNGNLRSTADILNDLSGWFQKYAGSQLAADQATKIFGRGNANLAGLLGMTKDQMVALDAEANRLGLIVGTDQLDKWRAFDAEIKASGDVVKGLELALGHGLMPIFAVLGSAITDFITQNLQALVAWLATAVSWVVGFIEELTGNKFAFSDFAAAISQISSQVAQLGTIQDLSGASSQAAANATRDATQAITDQIDALRQQNQLLQEQTDAQIASLQAEGQAEAFNNRKLQQTQKIADDQKNIAKLRSDYDRYLLIGDLGNAQTVNDEILAAQEQLANDQAQLSTDEADRERQLKIKALQDAQKASNDTTNDLITQLQNRQRAISQADAQTLTGARSTAGGMTAAFAKAGDDFTKGLDKASATAGKDMADNFKSAMDDIWATFDPNASPARKAKAAKDWSTLGNEIGNALGHGIVAGVGQAIADGIGNLFNAIGRGVVQAGKTLWDDLQNANWGNLSPDVLGASMKASWDREMSGFAAGGFVGGRPAMAGAPRIIQAHDGELILNVAQQRNVAAAIGGGGGATVHATFNIYGTDDATVRIVMQKIRQGLGRL